MRKPLDRRGRRATPILLASALTAAGTLALLGLPPAHAAGQPVGDARATVETEPTGHAGDSADDPAIWRHPTDPARSVVIGNDKGGALEVYDLAGRRIQRLTGGFFGNVDVLPRVRTGTGTVDLVVVYRAGLRVYALDPGSRQLRNVTDTASGSIPTPAGGEGLCLYRSPEDGAAYAFSNTRNGHVSQFALTDADGDGKVEGREVRGWDVGSEIEACVADDDTGEVYISEEDVGIWKYGAEPEDSTTSRTLVDDLVGDGGHLSADVEGLALVDRGDGNGYLLASAQAPYGEDNFYAVYERQRPHRFVRTFRVVDGPAADGCSHTDGIAALAADLGPAFPQGLFVCQDDRNTAPGSSGRAVTIVTSGYAKGVMTVAAYRGGSVTTSGGAIETADSARHVTPAVTAPDGQQWLVSYWSDKATSTTTWTLPSGVTRRESPLGTGTGHTSAVLGDSDGAVASGARGSLAATADATGSAAVMFSILLG